jgi:hypothetical protein
MFTQLVSRLVPSMTNLNRIPSNDLFSILNGVEILQSLQLGKTNPITLFSIEYRIASQDRS